MKEYEITIGLEVHVQLKTKSKMFCGSSAEYFGASPNSHTCPVCLGLPGALPAINQKAIESAVKVGLALNCTINKETKFDRKNYFYPDLPKGYQISQYDLPVAQEGYIFVGERKIRINRAHMEEDTGKLIHTKVNGEMVSLVDFNRSGVPLMEIVSEPDISSPAEARAYAKKLHQTMRYLEVADADMEKAGMRFDANVSVKPKGNDKLGTKVEIKNINSFSFLEKALAYEAERQINEIKKGEKIIQETRGWVESKGQTVSQRKKETSPDYRYFPEPDLPPLTISEPLIKKLRSELPEGIDEKIARFQKDYALSEYDSVQLTESKEVANWFEEVVVDYCKIEQSGKVNHIDSRAAKIIANWVLGEVLRVLKEKSQKIQDSNLEPAALVELIHLEEAGKVTRQSAKKVFQQMFETGQMASKIIKEEGLAQLDTQDQLEVIVDKVIQENPKAVADFKSGKEQSLKFLQGQVMRETKGAANPKITAGLIAKKVK